MPPRRENDDEHEAPPVLTWMLPCADVDRAPAQSGYSWSWQATEAERAVIVEALGLAQCFTVAATCTIRARAGTRYVLDGPLTAPDGTTLNVRTAWYTDPGNDIPRFVTAHPLPKL